MLSNKIATVYISCRQYPLNMPWFSNCPGNINRHIVSCNLTLSPVFICFRWQMEIKAQMICFSFMKQTLSFSLGSTFQKQNDITVLQRLSYHLNLHKLHCIYTNMYIFVFVHIYIIAIYIINLLIMHQRNVCYQACKSPHVTLQISIQFNNSSITPMFCIFCTQT